MSTPADLMGLGVPAGLAGRLGNLPVAVTAAGTISTTATTLTGGHTYIVTAASSQTGVIITNAQSVGEQITVTVPSSTSAVVYPPAGSTFNTAASTSLTLAQYKTAFITRLTSTTFSALVGA